MTPVLAKNEINKELLKRYIENNDILNWGRLLFPHKFNLPFCLPLHNYFIEIIDEPFTSTLAPRNHSKTTIKCFLLPLFLALNYPLKYYYYLNVQSTTSKAISINLSIRQEFETNELLREYYGDLVGEKWTEKVFILKSGIIFGGWGAGESIRGLNINNIRPDYIVCDDLYDDDDKYNPKRIDKKNRWFWSSLYPARAKTKNNCMHVQGTAISNKDIMHVLAKLEDIKFKKFKAIINLATKKVLWPELNTFEDLMKDKIKMGSSIFNSEMQNEVRDDESSIIKQAWIQYYREISSNEEIIGYFLGVDPSIGQGDKSDFTGMIVVMQTKVKDSHDSYRWYIRDIVNERLTMQERINTINSLHSQYNFRTALVEGIAGFKDFVAELKRTTNVPVIEINSVKNKINNLENNQSKFENLKVFIYEVMNLKKKGELVEQLINNFPEHDDVRDSLLLCLNNSTSDIRITSL